MTCTDRRPGTREVRRSWREAGDHNRLSGWVRELSLSVRRRPCWVKTRALSAIAGCCKRSHSCAGWSRLGERTGPRETSYAFRERRQRVGSPCALSCNARASSSHKLRSVRGQIAAPFYSGSAGSGVTHGCVCRPWCIFPTTEAAIHLPSPAHPPRRGGGPLTYVNNFRTSVARLHFSLSF